MLRCFPGHLPVWGDDVEALLQPVGISGSDLGFTPFGRCDHHVCANDVPLAVYVWEAITIMDGRPALLGWRAIAIRREKGCKRPSMCAPKLSKQAGVLSGRHCRHWGDPVDVYGHILQSHSIASCPNLCPLVLYQLLVNILLNECLSEGFLAASFKLFQV